MQKHPRQMRPRHFAPMAFVATLLVTLLLALFSNLGLLLFDCITTVYLIANIIASALTAKNNNWRLLPLFPITFATLHLSYGLGSLVGLVKFWHLWAECDFRSLSSRAQTSGQGPM